MVADDVNASPVANVLDLFTYRQWQAPTENEYFEIDFARNVSLQAFCLVFPRKPHPYQRYETPEILSSDLVRHRVDADGGTPGSGAVLDTGAIACGADGARGYSVTLLQAPVVGRYWRCEIDATSRATEGFFLLSLAFAGPVFQPSFPQIFGDRIGFPDNAEIQRTPSSQTPFPARAAKTLEASLTWDFIPDDEKPFWEAMTEYAGKTEPVLFAQASKLAVPFGSVQGPSGWVLNGRHAFLGLVSDDSGLTSRENSTFIKQVQMTEHR